MNGGATKSISPIPGMPNTPPTQESLNSVNNSIERPINPVPPNIGVIQRRYGTYVRTYGCILGTMGTRDAFPRQIARAGDNKR